MSPQQQHLLELPDELLVRILAVCDAPVLLSLLLCCRKLRNILQDDGLWGAVFKEHFGCPPVYRIHQKWREEYRARMAYRRKWMGRCRSLVSCGIPRELGDRFAAEYDKSNDFVWVAGRDGVLKVEYVSNDGKGRRTKSSKINTKRTAFFYSTRFSERSLVSAASFLKNLEGVVLGFDDGAVTVIRGLPKSDWDDCTWYNLSSSGPPIQKLHISGKYLIACAQRPQSELQTTVSLFDWKKKIRMEQLMKDRLSFVDCQNGSLTTYGAADEMVFDLPILHILQGFRISAGGLRGPSGAAFELKNSNRFWCEKAIVFVPAGAPNDLVLFSLDDFMITRRVTLSGEVINACIAEESIVVFTVNGSDGCQLHILDSVNGDRLCSRSLKHPGVSVIACSSGSIHFLISSEVCFFSISQMAEATRIRSPRTQKVSTRQAKVSIDEGLQEHADEQCINQHMDRQRVRMNIEGMSEAELIEYAKMLSLGPA